MARIIYTQDYAGTLNKVAAIDQPGPGGGCHVYRAEVSAGDDRGSFPVNFQKGPVKEVGINGLQNEHLLAMIIDRLQGFQSGPFACEENARALEACETALDWMNKRTTDRASRGAEGKNEV